MASNRGSLAKNIRECPVCLDDMTKKNPKLLTCKHSCCTPCLSGLAVAHQRSGLKIQCPKCRHNTVVRSGKLSDLPDNFLLVQLKAALDEQVRYPNCFYCNKLDKETKADGHCTNCRRYLCEDCLNKHKNSKQFADHEIISCVDEEKKFGEVCSTHNETALYVCRACSPARLLCDVCITLEDPCHDPGEFIDYTDALSELQSELKMELSKKRDFDEKLSKLDSEKLMMITEIQKNVDTFIKHIEATKDEIISKIEKSYDTTSLKFAVNAVKETELRVKELVEKDKKKVTELSAVATQFASTLKKLSDQEVKARSCTSDGLPGHKEEKIITGIGATYMKLKLFDLSSFRGDSEVVTPEVPEVDNPLSVSTRLNKNKVHDSKAGGDRGTSVKIFKEKVPIPVDPKTLKTDFDIGSSVEIKIGGAAEYGIIRWVGFYNDPDRPIVGIEMEEESDGGTDGTYMRHRLFQCPPRKARFSYLSNCRPDDRPDRKGI